MTSTTEIISTSTKLSGLETMPSVCKTCLLEVVENGSFWTISDRELLHIIKKEFPLELEYLKSAYAVRQHGWHEIPGSPSRILFPDEQVYDEINRSLIGVLSLRWINANQYEKFTSCQPESVRLRTDSFQWIRNVFQGQGIIDSKDYKLYALVTSMITNDLGKSTSFVQDYFEATGDDIRHENHDLILHRAAHRSLVPALERLEPTFRSEIKRGIKLGSEFNVGQLAQAENAPASLVPILDLVNHEEAWNLRWMEQLLDIAGAAGHEDHTGARKLIEPIFRSYRSVYDIVTGIVRGELNLRQGYNQNLVTRYGLITASGWRPRKQLDVANSEDRAFMRLLCMGNAATSYTADLYHDTFYCDKISAVTRQQLVRHLNRDGTVDEPAVQPTYGPGMMNLAMDNLYKARGADVGLEEQSRTLAALLRYLARVLAEPPSSEMVAEGDVTVIERDCRVAIKDIIQSEQFLKHPELLDTAPLPKDVVANRRREPMQSPIL